uniref:Transcription factor 19 n=1 Tax=Homo sapiens TaxID=9606 RepID=A0A9L9PXX5_HUMAN
MLPCFQLLRIGGGRGGDLYTFHPPAGAGCTYRLGHRADLCDVALRPQQEPGLISGIHAELHAEPRGDDWRVSLEDHSSQGTLVNNVRLPRGHRLELSDGDLLTFGPEGPPGTSPSEFYFMFQQLGWTKEPACSRPTWGNGDHAFCSTTTQSEEICSPSVGGTG